VALPAGKLLVSTDTAVGGVHLHPALTPTQMGYRACACALSDIAAMGAAAQFLTVAIAVPAGQWGGVEAIVDGVRERAAQVGRSADLVCDLEPAPAYIRRDFLRKIAVELVDNAFKFSPAGSTVRVSTGCRSGRTLLTVTDRGPGMPDEAARPPDENYVPNEHGVGLGLAIVRRVVALAGGQMSVSLPAGGGTTVVVSLPSTRLL